MQNLFTHDFLMLGKNTCRKLLSPPKFTLENGVSLNVFENNCQSSVLDTKMLVKELLARLVFSCFLGLSSSFV